MKNPVARLIPDGLAARFALVLALALVAANLAALGVLSLQQMQQRQAAREGQEIERIIALVPALEAIAPAARPAVARNASTRIARVSVERMPRVQSGGTGARSASLGARLSEALGDRDVRVAIRDRGANDGGASRHPRHPRRPREVIAISIALAGTPANWLNVITTGDHRRGGVLETEVFFVILLASLVAVLGVGLLFVRRLTRPLNDLAQAARAAGRGDRTVRVAENGARELRDAAAAFNTMQAQIARFDAERTRTLAAVGHDLRTPITSLRIRAEMLEDAARAPMVRTLDEMAIMADGLVAFARGDAAVEEKGRLDLGDLLSRLCEDRGASMDVACAAAVLGRPVELSRAFGNLIDNAVRYGNTARVRLTLSGDDAVVTIDDDGPGIPQDRLADIFEPFVRGDASRSTETGGAGLGLSIARQIIRAHGGTVDLANLANLANLEGRGLRVTVMLPSAG